MPAPEGSAPKPPCLYPESDGRHVFWALDRGRLVYLGLIISTLQQAEFAEIHSAAVALHDAFDARWPTSDYDEGHPGFTSTWTASRVDVELYWHAPNSLGPHPESAIQLAVALTGKPGQVSPIGEAVPSRYLHTSCLQRADQSASGWH